MKQDTLADTIKDIRKRFGPESITTLEDVPQNVPVLCSSGSLALDWAIGLGGYPKGRVIELYGLESSGKTTLALQGIAQAQKLGLACAFIDAEHALDPQHAIRLGVDTSKLLIVQPNSGEEALQLVEALASSGNIGFIVVDSVAALTPKAEIEGLIGDFKIGLIARLMGQAMRVIVPVLKKTGTTVLFINQIRLQAVMFGHGNPEYTPGGKALKFYASVRIELKRTGNVKKGEEPVGTMVKARIAKNKVGSPLKTVELEILFGNGVVRERELLYLGELFGLVDGNDFGTVKLGRGVDSNTTFLMKHPEIAQELEMAVREKMVSPA
jgi:recombination protein RecA